MLKCTLYIYIYVCIIIFNPYLDFLQMPIFTTRSPEDLASVLGPIWPDVRVAQLPSKLLSWNGWFHKGFHPFFEENTSMGFYGGFMEV